MEHFGEILEFSGNYQSYPQADSQVIHRSCGRSPLDGSSSIAPATSAATWRNHANCCYSGFPSDCMGLKQELRSLQGTSSTEGRPRRYTSGSCSHKRFRVLREDLLWFRHPEAMASGPPIEIPLMMSSRRFLRLFRLPAPASFAGPGCSTGIAAPNCREAGRR